MLSSTDCQKGPTICQIRRTALSIRHIIADCIKYNQDRIDHIRYLTTLITRLIHGRDLDLINFLKQTNLHNCI